MKLQKLAGVTSEVWEIFIANSASTSGAGLTGLVFGSVGLTAYYHRNTGTTATAITLATMTVGTFTSSGFKEIDATNMPGWYQFCPPDAALAAGAKSCSFHLKGAANMADLPIEVQLTAVNVDSATAFVTSIASLVAVGAGAIVEASFGVGAVTSTVLATNAAQEIADAYLDRADAVEVGLTPRQLQRLVAAALAGKASGLETTTAVYRNAVADSKARITATVDEYGNRTAVTTDVT